MCSQPLMPRSSGPTSPIPTASPCIAEHSPSQIVDDLASSAVDPSVDYSLTVDSLSRRMAIMFTFTACDTADHGHYLLHWRTMEMAIGGYLPRLAIVQKRFLQRAQLPGLTRRDLEALRFPQAHAWRFRGITDPNPNDVVTHTAHHYHE